MDIISTIKKLVWGGTVETAEIKEKVAEIKPLVEETNYEARIVSLKENALLLDHLISKGVTNPEVEATAKQLAEIIKELEAYNV